MEPALMVVVPVPGVILMTGRGPEGPPSIEGLAVPRVIPIIKGAGRVAAGACRPCGDPAPMLPPWGAPNPTVLGCKRP